MSEISAAMQELAHLEEKRHQQGLTPEEANHADQLRAYLEQFQGVGGEAQAWAGDADPNAQWTHSPDGWGQDPNAQWSQPTEGWQDPNAPWQQPAEGWEQDPNAQWPQQSAEGWQDPNAQWPQQPGAEGWQQDPNAQWPQQTAEGWQDPNAQWPQQQSAEGWQDPNAQWPQPPGAEGWQQDPNAQWPQQPGAEGWQQDPDAQWPQQAAEGWQDPNAQWPQQAAEGWQDPNAQWPQQAAEGWQDPNAQWPQQAAEGWQDPNAQWPQQPEAEGWQGDAHAEWQPTGPNPDEASAPEWQPDAVGAEEAVAAPQSQTATGESAASTDPEPSVDAAHAHAADEAPPGSANPADPSHAWLDEGVDAAPSPWVTAPQAPAAPPPPNAVSAEEGSLDLGREVDLPALEAPPDWMNSPVPPATGSGTGSTGASLNLGAFDDPSAAAEETEASMEIASLSAPISTPVPDGDLALTKSLQSASPASTTPPGSDAAVSDRAPVSEAADDEMEVSDADIIEVSDDDVTLIDDDEEAPVALQPPAPSPVPAPAPRRPIRIAGGLGPTPTPAASTLIPRETPLPQVAATSAWTGAATPTVSADAQTTASSVPTSPSSRAADAAITTAADDAGAAASGASHEAGPSEVASPPVADAPAFASPTEDAAAQPQDVLQEKPADEATQPASSATEPTFTAASVTGSEPEPLASEPSIDERGDPAQTGIDLAKAAEEITADPVYGLEADAEAAASGEDGTSTAETVQEVTSEVSEDSAQPGAPAGEDPASAELVAPATVDASAGEAASSEPEVSLSAPVDAWDVQSIDASPNAFQGESEAVSQSVDLRQDPAEAMPTAEAGGPAFGLPDAALEEDVVAAEATEPAAGDAEVSSDPNPADLIDLEIGEADEAPVQQPGTDAPGDARVVGAPEFGLPEAQPSAPPEPSITHADEVVAASYEAATSPAEPAVPAGANAETGTAESSQAAAPPVAIPLPSAAEEPAEPSAPDGRILDTLPFGALTASLEGDDANASEAVASPASAPMWGPPPQAGPPHTETEVQSQRASEAVTELAEDDASVPVLDLGDLTLASPISEGESDPQAGGPSDAAELPSEMFEPLQPEEAPAAAMEPEPAAEIELAEDPRVLEVIAQPTEIELKEVALGDGVFGNTLEISELELAEPGSVDWTDGDEAAASPAPTAAAAEAPAEGGDGDEVELELELSDVEPEPAATASDAQPAPDADADDFEVDLSDGEVEPPMGAYTPSTPPAIVTRFGAQERASASGHTSVHTERAPSIPLPGAATTSSFDDNENLPEAELELELDEPAFESEEVEATSTEVEIELNEADAHFGEEHLPEPSMEIELTEAEGHEAGEALPEPSLEIELTEADAHGAGVDFAGPSMEIELSDVAEPAMPAPLPEPTMEIELVEPEPPPAAPAAQVPAPEPVQAPVPAAATEAWVTGEHRVILHTVEGHVLRGTLRNANLLAPEIPLELQPGQPPERVPASRAKAVFFMLSSGQPQPTPEGSKIRITFHDGRQVPGYATAHASDAAGFFVVPVDNRTNTARIFVYRSSIQAISNG